MKKHKDKIARLDRALAASQRWQQAESLRQTIPKELRKGDFNHMYRTQVVCGLVYVALESYDKTKAKDAAVEALATPSLRQALRGLRNVVFHEQGEMFDKRWVKFFTPGSDNVTKTGRLHAALGKFLNQQIIREAAEAAVRAAQDGVDPELIEDMLDARIGQQAIDAKRKASD